MPSLNSFSTRSTLRVAGKEFVYYDLAKLGAPSVARLPFSLKVLLENLLRNEDGAFVKRADIETFAKWDAKAGAPQEIAFRVARVLLQDFTGVPAVVDLAAMRDAIARLGGDAKKINPLQPADLVIDHSVQVDEFGTEAALLINTTREFERNEERYAFLRWGQSAFRNFSVVPPGTGICHQVNLEYLGRTVFTSEEDGKTVAYPDTLVGTDSHTTMVNGLGVLGWGVGGIEAEASMLGQPLSMLLPEVVGFKMHGRLPAGATATDLVLVVTQMLRKKKVVGKFVEFYGAGLSSLALADRATIANMAPEYGATAGFFPVDDETIRYLSFTGRGGAHAALVEAYCKAQGMFRTDDTPDPQFSDTIELDLSTVEPSLAGPKRPQDRVPLKDSKRMFAEALESELERIRPGQLPSAERRAPSPAVEVTDGAVVIAAITSCTNTSNPSVMIAAGLLAKKAVAKGLTRKPWVKTSLAPGSKVVTDYYNKAGLTAPLDQLGFYLAGYGCTTCIGNSGPLPPEISKQIDDQKLVVAAVLSGNRNFEGRVNPQTRFNYLASPPLVVAYAIAGRMDIDFETEPLGTGTNGPVFLRDVWPSPKEVADTILSSVKSEMFTKEYADVFTGDDRWRALKVPTGDRFTWSDDSTYVRNPPYFDGMTMTPPGIHPVRGARVLAMLGDSITTDHISPAGSIAKNSPAGAWLMAHGQPPSEFNSYGARRGNHEVMIRGTFANIRLRNELAPGTEGGVTASAPGGTPQPIYDAAIAFQAAGTPLIVIAGKEYGTGSSRDWAAKGTRLLGVRAVIAESFERIHRSNLVGMGVLPLEFMPGETRATLGLTGFERYDISGLDDSLAPRATLTVTADGSKKFQVRCRIDTPEEGLYFRNGGILQYVLRNLVKS
jgi:aconitate hydratase